MDAVLRAASVYVFLLLMMRLSGRRTFAEITNFDFVLLLILGEATQQALLGDDFSVTNAFIVIVTLLFIDILLSLWKRRHPRVERWLESLPLVVVEHGRPRHDLLHKARLDLDEVLEAARRTQGLARLEQIRYAILERNGGISIIPQRDDQRA